MFIRLSLLVYLNWLPNDTFPDWSKSKECADDNFKFDKNGRMLSIQTGRKPCGKKEKLLVTSNFSLFHNVFKRLILHTRKNQGLFRKGIKHCRQRRKNADHQNFLLFSIPFSCVKIPLRNTVPQNVGFPVFVWLYNDLIKNSLWFLVFKRTNHLKYSRKNACSVTNDIIPG